MAEIDGLDSFVRTTRAVLEEFPGPTIVLPRAAVEAFVAAAEAHLRAPKGELEEARAELGAWLVEDHDRRFWRIAPEVRGFSWGFWLTVPDGTARGKQVPGTGPTEAAAIRAALSRARGEGT